LIAIEVAPTSSLEVQDGVRYATMAKNNEISLAL
jgi:hypothetical protein